VPCVATWCTCAATRRAALQRAAVRCHAAYCVAMSRTMVQCCNMLPCTASDAGRGTEPRRAASAREALGCAARRCADRSGGRPGPATGGGLAGARAELRRAGVQLDSKKGATRALALTHMHARWRPTHATDVPCLAAHSSARLFACYVPAELESAAARALRHGCYGTAAAPHCPVSAVGRGRRKSRAARGGGHRSTGGPRASSRHNASRRCGTRCNAGPLVAACGAARAGRPRNLARVARRQAARRLGGRAASGSCRRGGAAAPAACLACCAHRAVGMVTVIPRTTLRLPVRSFQVARPDSEA
jgi:hypothetical protein